MPLRFRRKRIILISILSIFLIVYLINNRSEELIIDENNLSDTQIKQDDVKRSIKEIIREVNPTTTTTTTTTSQIPSREEIFEFNGKKFKKIDWHDYELISREHSRTGIF
jgi:hypothetical protein